MRALPWTLLGKRCAYLPSLDASAAQMVLNMEPKLPGQLLGHPGPPLNTSQLKGLLDQLYRLSDRPGTQTTTRDTRVKLPQTELATHVYIKKAEPKSLCPSFEGPYKIVDRPSNTTVTLQLSVKKDGTPVLQTYNWSWLKIAHLRDGAGEASRPRPGRPRKIPSPTSDHDEGSSSTEVPEATMESPDASSKQTGSAGGGSQSRLNHETSNPEKLSPSAEPAERGNIQNYDTLSGRRPHPEYLRKGPIITSDMYNQWTPDLLGVPSRSSRSTRNPNPRYIDALAA